jgi:small subunit ribosomal protein S17
MPEAQSNTAPSDAADDRAKRKVVQGRVKSSKMQKTIVVEIARMIRHPKYGKFMRRTSHFFADDPKNEARPGDFVEIMETRPLSKLKRWRLVRIVERPDQALEFKSTDPSAEINAATGATPAKS